MRNGAPLRRAALSCWLNTRNLDREPIGLMDTVATVTPAQLRQFYQRWYQPNNMTFIVVGDIDSKEALALIKDNLSKLPANKAAENRVWPTKKPKTTCALISLMIKKTG